MFIMYQYNAERQNSIKKNTEEKYISGKSLYTQSIYKLLQECALDITS